MTALTRRALAFALPGLAWLGLPAVSHAGQGWRMDAFTALSAVAQDQVRSASTPGLALGISAPGFRKMSFWGDSDLETSAPVSEATQFRIASVTKPMTAAAILKLRDQGHFSLDDPIGTFFPDFPNADAVTVRQLLSHTSGIANWWGRLPEGTPDSFMDQPRPHRVLARMEPVYLFAPGQRWSYSNSGYLLLGEIIEQITGHSFESALSAGIFAQCGANDIRLEYTGNSQLSWATGYQTLENGQRHAVGATPMPFAAGGLRSNLHDVLAFADALFHARLLARESLAELARHAQVADGRRIQDAVFVGDGSTSGDWPPATSEMGYGLGINTWVQGGERFYSHSGLIDGFSAYLIHAPRTLTTFAYLANSQDGGLPLHQLARDHMIAAPTP